MPHQFEYYGSKSPQKQKYQFLKHENHPFYLYTPNMLKQKVDYIHNIPVETGFVNQSHEWRLRSANEQPPI